MREELDRLLCERYPKIFRNRNASINTPMAWGFECDDGWFNILEQLCSAIQWHIDQRRKARADDLRYNRALARAIRGDKEALIAFYCYKDDNERVREWAEKRATEDLSDPEPQARIPTEYCEQIVAAQVKEKFGTLRFYYDGQRSEYIRGLVAMAEAMSAVTCEVCGSPGTLRGGRWRRTLCDRHAKPEETALPADSLNREA